MSESGWETIQGLKNVLEGHPVSIAKACQAVEKCLELNRDNLRAFFEQCFVLLLKQVFGYEGTSWLSIIAKGGMEADAKAMVELLSPGGRLFSAMFSADMDSLVKFIFPLERLPTHTQLLLSSESGRATLESWPQYKGNIRMDAAGRCQVHLPVFHYFVFWTAFYVLRSGTGPTDAVLPRPYHRLHLAPSLGSVRRTLRLTRTAHVVEGHPYLRLLRLYLEHFLPRPGFAKPPPPSPGPGSLADYTRAAGGGFELRSAGPSRGQVFLSVLVEFWLTDGNEPLLGALPVPDGVPAAGPQETIADPLDGFGSFFGLAPSGPSLRAVSFEAPSEDLLEAVTVLARYITAQEQPDSRDKPMCSALLGPTAWLPLVPVQPGTPQGLHPVGTLPPSRLGASGSPAAQAFAVNLYRFLWRALTLWPEVRSTSAVVNLWLAYIAPWWLPPTAQVPGAAEPGSPWRAGPSPAGAHSEGLAHQLSQVADMVHSALGESYHLSSRAAHEEVESHYEPAEWQPHVLCNLPFYSLLFPAFLDLTLSRVSSRGESSVADLLKVLSVFRSAPELCNLIRSVEAEYRRYIAAPGRRPEGRYAELLPFLADQAQSWCAAALADSTAASSSLPGLPELVMFSEGPAGGAAKVAAVLQRATGAVREEMLQVARASARHFLPLDAVMESGPASQMPSRSPGDSSGGLTLARWQEVKVRGDPMLLPLSDWEWHWLARLAVHVSILANRHLDLGRSPRPSDPAPASLLEVAAAYCRKRGVRVNLRPVADKRNMLAIMLIALATWITWTLLTAFWWLLTQPLDDSETYPYPGMYKYEHSGYTMHAYPRPHDGSSGL